MGIAYVIVNARSSSISGITPGFEPGRERFAPPDGAPPGFQNGERPEFPGGGRNEFRGERGGGGWLSEALKNIAIIGIIVAMVVLPKSWTQKRKRAAQVAEG
jgi:hypothetical protein